LIFTNKDDRTCQLEGFPGVSYIAGNDAHQVGPAAERTGDVGAAVRLAPGDMAAAPLQLVNVQNFDAAACQPTPVRGLRVYPPGETVPLTVPIGGIGCAGSPPGPQLTVRTVVAY
jgi:hypothetical protein